MNSSKKRKRNIKTIDINPSTFNKSNLRHRSSNLSSSGLFSIVAPVFPQTPILPAIPSHVNSGSTRSTSNSNPTTPSTGLSIESSTNTKSRNAVSFRAIAPAPPMSISTNPSILNATNGNTTTLQSPSPISTLTPTLPLSHEYPPSTSSTSGIQQQKQHQQQSHHYSTQNQIISPTTTTTATTTSSSTMTTNLNTMITTLNTTLHQIIKLHQDMLNLTSTMTQQFQSQMNLIQSKIESDRIFFLAELESKKLELEKKDKKDHQLLESLMNLVKHLSEK